MAEKNSEDLEHHMRNLSIAKAIGSRAREGLEYYNIGTIYQLLGDFKHAIEYHKEGLSIAKEVGDRAVEGDICCNLGNVYQSLGDFTQAITYFKQDLIIAKDVGDRTGEGRAYCNLGIAYRSLGHFKKAIKYHKQHLSIAKEMGDRLGVGRAYCNLGNAYENIGDFTQAIQCHKQDLNIAIEMGDKAGEGTSYGNLGIVHRSVGDLKQAIYYHNKSLSIAKELRDRAGEGRAYGNLGSAYCSTGDFKKAIDYHKQDLSVAKELGDRAGEGSTYCNLGVAYGYIGNYEQAIENYEESLKISKEVGDRAGEGRAYCNLGNAHQKLDKVNLAIEYHRKDLNIAKEVGDKAGEGTSYENLGRAYQSLGDFKQAIEYHKKGLSIAKAVGSRVREGAAYGNLGNAYHHLGYFKQAIEYHKEHLRIAKETGSRVAEGDAYGDLGDAYLCLCDFEQAVDCYRSSVKLFNDVRALLQSEDAWKISFRNQFQQAYTSLWRTLVRISRYDEALCVADQGRAQALADLVKLQYEFGLLPFRSLELCTLSDISAQTVFVALESNTINLWVVYKGDVQFKQNKVNDEDAATFLDCLRKDAFKENHIGDRVKCENRSLDQLREQLSLDQESHQEIVESSHCENNSLRLLYDSIISPIANILQGDELIIVPDGPLWLAPFAAFVDDASKYLSESIRILVIPSLTCLKLIADCPESYHGKSGALLVGDPCVEEVVDILGKPRLEQLPNAKMEVEMIGDILNIAPLTGKEATKDEVLKQIASVALVHIAAHGKMETGEIALAPSPARKYKIPEENDYILKIADVQAVKLRAKLVVLSCCHSGRGKVSPEGVVGIARAFLGAGARSVLVALWAIDDEATMEFMTCFYKHLRAGSSASVALNQAMKCLRESEKFNAVKYWAPFVLIGDDVTLEFGQKE
ncbi:hypothetical protein ACROYT_G042509 [Oculina patagonica]